MPAYHKPVMLKEVIESLAPEADDVIVDGTIGGGGHCEDILKFVSGKGMVVGIDLDAEALAESKKKLFSLYGSKIRLVKGNFRDLDIILKSLGIEEVDGVLLDLGVSSHQFDVAERGFSLTKDGNLDMRMDTGKDLSAFNMVNDFSEVELKKIIREYGEERWSGKIAASIVQKRNKDKISSTIQLAEIISNSIPRKYWPRRIHPATKTFQAFRIAVNNELENLRKGLEVSCRLLKKEGRLCVISYHSLEDRIVKSFIAQEEKGCLCPPNIIKCVCGRKPLLKRINRKPLKPSQEEIEANPRARSAILRAAEKIV